MRWHLAWTMAPFLHARGYWHDQVAIGQTAWLPSGGPSTGWGRCRCFAPWPPRTPSSVLADLPVAFGLKLSARCRRPRIRIVNKRHAMTDEDLVFNGHSLTNKSVAGNLASPPNGRIF